RRHPTHRSRSGRGRIGFWRLRNRPMHDLSTDQRTSARPHARVTDTDGLATDVGPRLTHQHPKGNPMTTSQPVHKPVSALTEPEIKSISVPGWRLTFTAGFVPLIAGLLVVLVTWVGIVRAGSAWWVGTGSLDFSYASLFRAGSDAPVWVELTGSVGGVNIVAAAVAVSVVSMFGLRSGQRWAWWFLAFCLTWVGLHDAIAATRFSIHTGQPLMLLPYTYCILM